MALGSHRRGRHGFYLLAATLLAASNGLTLFGAGLLQADTSNVHSTGFSSTAPADAGQTPSEPGHGFARLQRASPPVALTIARIDLRASRIVRLGVRQDGSIQVPVNPNEPGWYEPGPAPGQLGPAIIAGHVDSTSGPAIFYRLSALKRGDRIGIKRADGITLQFAVDQVASYPKSHFPTRRVYGRTNRAELRLITCGGVFDPDDGYRNNTVVFAHLSR